MKPNSGIYNIKIKIGKIDNEDPWSNIIGITTEKYDNNHEKLNISSGKKKYAWYDDSNNYIGCDEENDKRLPNGLYCGNGVWGRTNNIFRKNNFI